MTELEECQHALGRAIEVIAITCDTQGQQELALTLMTAWRDKRYDDLTANLIVMADSFRPESTAH